MKEYCVYIYKSFGDVLYVGLTSDKVGREKAHMKTSKWFSFVTDCEYIECEGLNHALMVEAENISLLEPIYNKDRPSVDLAKSRYMATTETPGEIEPHITNLDFGPSEQAKAVGLESLAQVVRISGVSQRTLINWHKHKPQLFAVVLAGCFDRHDNQNVAENQYNACAKMATHFNINPVEFDEYMFGYIRS